MRGRKTPGHSLAQGHTRQQINNLDVYAFDEKDASWQSKFRQRGMVRKPGVAGRPELAAEALDVLRSAGIDLERDASKFQSGAEIAKK